MSPVARHSCAHALRPRPRLRRAPLAQREDDRPAARAQRLAHLRVRVARVLALAAAPVVLEVVDAPRGVALRVLRLVVLRARPPGAGLRPRVGVDPELEALRVDVVGERLHPRREALRVDHDRAVGGAAHLPAVVDDDVLVAGGLHAARDERVGRAADQLARSRCSRTCSSCSSPSAAAGRGRPRQWRHRRRRGGRRGRRRSGRASACEPPIEMPGSLRLLALPRGWSRRLRPGERAASSRRSAPALAGSPRPRSKASRRRASRAGPR